MYKCNLILKNKEDWIKYAKEIISTTGKITDTVVARILTFPFEFGGEVISM